MTREQITCRNYGKTAVVLNVGRVWPYFGSDWSGRVWPYFGSDWSGTPFAVHLGT